MVKLNKKLVRPKEGGMIAGVCAGIANYFGVDIVLVRVVWAFLLIPGGVPGVLPYIICRIVIPRER